MEYKEYTEEGTDRTLLETEFIKGEDYELIQKNSVIVCHDVFIRYTLNNIRGILLVKRKSRPAKDVYWPIGGRVLRGVSILESLGKKVKSECSLTLSDITYLGIARTLFKDSAFNHEKGADTINLFYVANGDGVLALDTYHEHPLLVTKETYPELRFGFEDYVRDVLDYIDTKNLW